MGKFKIRGPKRLELIPVKYANVKGIEQLTTVRQLRNLEDYMSVKYDERPLFQKLGCSLPRFRDITGRIKGSYSIWVVTYGEIVEIFRRDGDPRSAYKWFSCSSRPWNIESEFRATVTTRTIINVGENQGIINEVLSDRNRISISFATGSENAFYTVKVFCFSWAHRTLMPYVNQIIDPLMVLRQSAEAVIMERIYLLYLPDMSEKTTKLKFHLKHYLRNADLLEWNERKLRKFADALAVKYLGPVKYIVSNEVLA